MIRRPAVAGSFYSGDANQLKSDIESFVIKDCKKQAVWALSLRMPDMCIQDVLQEIFIQGLKYPIR